MDRPDNVTSRFTLVAGLFLLIEGVWGLFSPVVYGVLTTNLPHAIIHGLLGAAGIWASRSGHARKWCLAVGSILLLVGILRLVPPTADLIMQLLAVNVPGAYVNIVIGILAIVMARLPDRREQVGA